MTRSSSPSISWKTRLALRSSPVTVSTHPSHGTVSPMGTVPRSSSISPNAFLSLAPPPSTPQSASPSVQREMTALE